MKTIYTTKKVEKNLIYFQLFYEILILHVKERGPTGKINSEKVFQLETYIYTTFLMEKDLIYSGDLKNE